MANEQTLAIDLRPIADELAEVRRELALLRDAVTSMRGEQEWVDVATAARRLGIHPATVRRAIRRGELESRRVGRCLRVCLTEEDVTEAARRVRAVR